MSEELTDALEYIDNKIISVVIRIVFLYERLAQFEERINKMEMELKND